MIKHVHVKFGSMRKADSCVVYPDRQDGTIQIQGERLIARFDEKTGHGYLNYKGSHSKYGQHLRPELGAEPFTASPELIAECKAAMPQSGDHIGGGVYIA